MLVNVITYIGNSKVITYIGTYFPNVGVSQYYFIFLFWSFNYISHVFGTVLDFLFFLHFPLFSPVYQMSNILLWTINLTNLEQDVQKER